jgi:hypothetical protein
VKPILSPEELGDVLLNPSPANVTRLAASHEQLRARVGALEAEAAARDDMPVDIATTVLPGERAKPVPK